METEKKKLVLTKVFSLDHHLSTTLTQLKSESSYKQSKRNLLISDERDSVFPTGRKTTRLH